MSNDTTPETLPQPAGGGSWIRKPDGSLVPNVPPVDASAESAEAPKPNKKGK
ncbi:hypothetical protein LQG66_03835 [Bradyrhizobium ontarionense]|uniref:Uncharacterized protein n=1 Tax=Bradyrhizobium ontarionense TaxID=2898149 RepID=A0ABY3REN0_9BRAD|nr:hypothetical protein [Bradyrhizobium sp. A19]UFZ05457.1 hypothetical protein LQG66_03835 [Bradyrhizobium sp. A19]